MLLFSASDIIKQGFLHDLVPIYFTLLSSGTGFQKMHVLQPDCVAAVSFNISSKFKLQCIVDDDLISLADIFIQFLWRYVSSSP